MNDKKKKGLLYGIIALAAIILTIVGSTFAYFTATVSSNENAVNMTAATFNLVLEEDTSLIKTNIIPSDEEYVDLASKVVDSEGHFLEPYVDETTGQTVENDTTCVDDNNYEICSIYTFTVKNPMTNMSLPLYITLIPSQNTFTNFVFKVLDEDLNEVIGASNLAGIGPIVLANINKTIPKAIDADTPSHVTYHIVMWIKETHNDQTDDDSGKQFSATLNVKASGADGNGITGTMNASGTE